MTLRGLRRVAALALACLALAAPASAEDGKAPPLTEKDLRVLLQDAAAAPRAPFDHVVRLGPLVRVEDMLAHGTLPLTLAMAVMPWRTYPEFHVARDITATDLVPLLQGRDEPVGPMLSLLRVGAQRELVMAVDGPRARGMVTFWLDERVRGQLEWRAEVVEGAWRVTDLLIPGLNQGVTRRGERWFLRSHGAARPASALVVPTASLPVLGLLGAVKDHHALYPDDVLHLTVGILGDVFGPQGRIGLDDVRGLATEGAHWMPRKGRVVLRVHAEAPWYMVGWTIDAVRAQQEALTPLALYVAGRSDERFHVRIDPPDPFGNEGVMALGRLEPQPPDAPDALVVHVDPAVGEVPAPTVYRALAEGLRSKPKGTRRVLLRVGGEGRLYVGHVLRIADLALRAGARDIDFVPLPLPEGPHGAEFGPDHTSAHMVDQAGFSVRIGTTELRGDPPVPAVQPKELEPAGADLR